MMMMMMIVLLPFFKRRRERIKARAFSLFFFNNPREWITISLSFTVIFFQNAG